MTQTDPSLYPAGASPAAPGVNWPRFGATLRTARRRILFLDYDGTLAPFHEDRMLAVPHPGIRKALASLMAAGHTRTVIVTGRTVDSAMEVLGLDPAPEIWGVHGWERRCRDGRREDFDPGPVVREGLRRALEPSRDPVWAGWSRHWEAKPTGLSFHFRGLPEPLQAHFRGRVEPLWRAIAAAHGIGLHRFDFGLELRVPGRTKGTVVAELLDDEPGPVAAAFLGDDFTDEDAFRELEARRDPAALGVLVRPEWRPTAAQAWVRPPAELLQFLASWDRAARTG